MSIGNLESTTLLTEQVNENPVILEEDLVWYLAYGSNMNKKIFNGKRKIQPFSARPCRVPNVFLSFDTTGIPYLEPTFASSLLHDPSTAITESYARSVHSRTRCNHPFIYDPVQPQNSLPPFMHGVVYRITRKQYEHIRNTEGGGGYDDVEFGYADHEVECECYDGEIIRAKTLVTKNKCSTKNFQPSVRYMEIIKEGARENQLDGEYQKYLASLQPYRITTIRTQIGRFLYLLTVLPLLILLLLTNLFIIGNVEKPRKLPRCLVIFQNYMMRIGLWLHEIIFKPLYGSGVNMIMIEGVSK